MSSSDGVSSFTDSSSTASSTTSSVASSTGSSSWVSSKADSSFSSADSSVSSSTASIVSSGASSTASSSSKISSVTSSVSSSRSSSTVSSVSSLVSSTGAGSTTTGVGSTTGLSSTTALVSTGFGPDCNTIFSFFFFPFKTLRRMIINRTKRTIKAATKTTNHSPRVHGFVKSKFLMCSIISSQKLAKNIIIHLLSYAYLYISYKYYRLNKKFSQYKYYFFVIFFLAYNIKKRQFVENSTIMPLLTHIYKKFLLQ